MYAHAYTRRQGWKFGYGRRVSKSFTNPPAAAAAATPRGYLRRRRLCTVFPCRAPNVISYILFYFGATAVLQANTRDTYYYRILYNIDTRCLSHTHTHTHTHIIIYVRCVLASYIERAYNVYVGATSFSKTRHWGHRSGRRRLILRRWIHFFFKCTSSRGVHLILTIY